MKTVAVLFAEGFEEVEAIAVVDVLRRAEVKVIMAGLGARSVTGAHGVTISMDGTLAELSADRLDAVVLPGGMPGAANLAASNEVKTLVRQLHAAGKLVAAICAAPWVLGAAGIAKGRRVTCYPGFEQKLPDAKCTGNRVEVDGRIITGKGPGAALEFALELVTVLVGAAPAGQLRQGMFVK